MIHFNTELGILVLLIFAFIDFGLAAWNRQFRKVLWRFGSRFIAIAMTVASTMLVKQPLSGRSVGVDSGCYAANIP